MSLKGCYIRTIEIFSISKGLRVTEIDLLARSFTYRIAIKADDYEKALNADVWPHRVGVRLFRNKRTFANTGSWASQSAQTGGNVMTNRQEYQNLLSARSTHSLVPVQQISGTESLALQNRFVTPGFATEVFN